MKNKNLILALALAVMALFTPRPAEAAADPFVAAETAQAAHDAIAAGITTPAQAAAVRNAITSIETAMISLRKTGAAGGAATLSSARLLHLVAYNALAQYRNAALLALETYQFKSGIGLLPGGTGSGTALLLIHTPWANNWNDGGPQDGGGGWGDDWIDSEPDPGGGGWGWSRGSDDGGNPVEGDNSDAGIEWAEWRTGDDDGDPGDPTGDDPGDTPSNHGDEEEQALQPEPEADGGDEGDAGNDEEGNSITHQSEGGSAPLMLEVGGSASFKAHLFASGQLSEALGVPLGFGVVADGIKVFTVVRGAHYAESWAPDDSRVQWFMDF